MCNMHLMLFYLPVYKLSELDQFVWE